MGHDEDLAVAVREVQERALEGAPGVAVYVHELGGRAVELVGDPADGGLHGGVGWVGHVVVAPHVAVESPDGHVVDAVFRDPVALLVGEEKRAVVV